MNDKAELTFLHILSTWMLKDNVESKVTPKYLALRASKDNIQRVASGCFLVLFEKLWMKEKSKQ